MVLTPRLACPQYGWECIELVRKFLLVGVARLPFLEPGSLKQIFYAIAVSLCHLTFLALAKPYVDNSDDYLAVGSAFMLTGVFVVCLLFQVDKLYDAVDTSLTHEYQELFEPEALFLTLAMAVLGLASLVALAEAIPVVR